MGKRNEASILQQEVFSFFLNTESYLYPYLAFTRDDAARIRLAFRVESLCFEPASADTISEWK